MGNNCGTCINDGNELQEPTPADILTTRNPEIMELI